MNFRISSFFLSKFSLKNNFLNKKREIHSTVGLCLKLTETLNAEPPKAKKKLDPALVKAKEDRRKRKIEKEIKKLERFGRQFKPIEELRADRSVLKEVDNRKRTDLAKLTPTENYDNQTLEVKWAKYKLKQFLNETNQISVMVKSQEKALRNLKKDDEKLYEMAISLDEKLIELKFNGPSYTPAIKAYDAPEGDYIDVTYLYDRK